MYTHDLLKISRERFVFSLRKRLLVLQVITYLILAGCTKRSASVAPVKRNTEAAAVSNREKGEYDQFQLYPVSSSTTEGGSSSDYFSAQESPREVSSGHSGATSEDSESTASTDHTNADAKSVGSNRSVRTALSLNSYATSASKRVIGSEDVKIREKALEACAKADGQLSNNTHPPVVKTPDRKASRRAAWKASHAYEKYESSKSLNSEVGAT
ncbi:MAG: hypothetical protein ACX93T_00805 [Bacteroidota bacterium]